MNPHRPSAGQTVCEFCGELFEAVFLEAVGEVLVAVISLLGHALMVMLEAILTL